ncbi:MAG: membrane protein insertion efficiency factor YidD [Planctomycetota bacterium]
MTSVGRLASWPFLALIYLYRWTLGPVVGGRCRFQPSCSTYALEAYRKHGPIRGTWLTVCRLSRCHPGVISDPHDPVPPVGKMHPSEAQTRTGKGGRG